MTINVSPGVPDGMGITDLLTPTNPVDQPMDMTDDMTNNWVPLLPSSSSSAPSVPALARTNGILTPNAPNAYRETAQIITDRFVYIYSD